MAVDPNNIGLTRTAEQPYLVSREKLREFARSVGETSEVCHDVAAARAAGFDDVVATPTFPVTFTLDVMGDFVTADPVGIDWSRVVHGDQRFVAHRPIVAGDLLTTVLTIEDLKTMAGNDMVTLRADLTDATGGAVGTVWTTLVQRGDA